MISLTHTPYPVTDMAWSSKGSDDWIDSSPFIGFGSLLIIISLLLLLLSAILSFPAFPFVLLGVAEKKDVMDFWSSPMSFGLLFFMAAFVRFLLLLLIPDVLPSNGGGSPRHGNFRRFFVYHSRRAERIPSASSSVKLW
jgi:hypothetical protein